MRRIGVALLNALLVVSMIAVAPVVVWQDRRDQHRR